MASSNFIDDSNPAAYLNIGKISILFNSKQCSGAPGDSFPDNYLSTSSVGSVQSDINETLRSTCLAYFNPLNSSPSNQAALDGLTSQFEQDYTNWRKVHFSYVFAGIINFAQSALVDCYEFSYSSTRETCSTRIYTYPLDWRVHELGHYDYDGDCENLTDTGKPNFNGLPCQYFYGPPSKCVGSTLQLTRYCLMLVDGRLLSTFVSND